MKRNGSGLRRNGRGLKRGGSLERSIRRLSEEEREDASAFWLAAQAQRLCARCGSPGPFDAHHVIERQYLEARGLPIFDPRNSLRLCHDCHGRHTRRERNGKLALKHLREENLAYAIDLLGPGPGEVLLHRCYTGEDSRLDRLILAAG